MRSDQETGGTCRVTALDSEVRYRGNVPGCEKRSPTARVVRRAMGLRFTSSPRMRRAYWFWPILRGESAGWRTRQGGVLWEEKGLGRPSLREAKCEVGKDRQSGAQVLGAHIIA